MYYYKGYVNFSMSDIQIDFNAGITITLVSKSLVVLFKGERKGEGNFVFLQVVLNDDNMGLIFQVHSLVEALDTYVVMKKEYGVGRDKYKMFNLRQSNKNPEGQNCFHRISEKLYCYVQIESGYKLCA